jgi:hypothetical protein
VRGVGGLALLVLAIGFVIKFWWVIVAVVVVAVAASAVWLCRMHHAAEIERRRRAHTAIAARADEQHAQVLAGNDRGIYGDYTPKAL